MAPWIRRKFWMKSGFAISDIWRAFKNDFALICIRIAMNSPKSIWKGNVRFPLAFLCNRIKNKPIRQSLKRWAADILDYILSKYNTWRDVEHNPKLIRQGVFSIPCQILNFGHAWITTKNGYNFLKYCLRFSGPGPHNLRSFLAAQNYFLIAHMSSFWWNSQKSAVFNILRQNETIFDVGNG